MSKQAFLAFEETIQEGLIIVPAMVLAEVMYIAKKGRVQISFAETLEKIENYENFEATLITKDKQIQDSGIVQTIW